MQGGDISWNADTAIWHYQTLRCIAIYVASNNVKRPIGVAVARLMCEWVNGCVECQGSLRHRASCLGGYSYRSLSYRRASFTSVCFLRNFAPVLPARQVVKVSPLRYCGLWTAAFTPQSYYRFTEHQGQVCAPRSPAFRTCKAVITLAS